MKVAPDQLAEKVPVTRFATHGAEERRSAPERWIEKLPLLFVSYVFVSIEAQWYRARWCPGVIRLIMDGLQPAKVPDSAALAIGQCRNAV